MKSSQGFSGSVIAATVVVAGLVAGTIPGARADNISPVPVNANAYGNTYGEWSARWWQWLLSNPSVTNPNKDITGANCSQRQSGPVFFLAGAFSGLGAVTRNCPVPAGKALFFPILNTLWGAGVGDCEPSVPGTTCNLADLRIIAANHVERNSVTLKASIDGNSLQNLFEQQVQSPAFTITWPDNNVSLETTGVDVPAGTYTPNVSDGYWLLLPPLSAGKHTIKFKGVQVKDSLTIEVNYILTVHGGT